MRGASTRAAPLVGAVLCLVSGAALAAEGGVSNFPIGAQTLGAAYLPPPGGTEFFGYFANVHSGTLRDDAGKPALPGFDAELVAAAPRVVHTWTDWHGFNFSGGALFEAAYAKVKAGGPSVHSSGFDLLGAEPLMVTTSRGNWHYLFETIIYYPVGEYHRDELAHSTIHHGGYVLQSAVTWTPTPRWDLSLNPDIEFNARNKATGYRSGSIFGLTGGASWRPFEADPRWQVGVNGYFQQQITDDHLEGVAVPGGYRLRKQAVGPQFAFWSSPVTVWLLKWQHEFDVRNGPQGDLVWFEFAFPL